MRRHLMILFILLSITCVNTFRYNKLSRGTWFMSSKPVESLFVEPFVTNELKESLSTSSIIQRIFSPREVNVKHGLQSLRMIGLEKLQSSVLPTAKSESWRFNNLYKLFRKPYVNMKHMSGIMDYASMKDQIKSYVNFACNNSYYVFVDGRFAPHLSSAMPSHDDGMQFLSLASMNSHQLQRFQDSLSFIPDTDELLRNSFSSDLLTSLNMANVEDGLMLYLPPQHDESSPIHLLFVSSGRDASMVHPKVCVVLDEGARLNLKQSHISASYDGHDIATVDDGAAYLINSNTRVVLGKHAQLNHTFTQELAAPARQLEVLSAELGESSNYNLVTLQSGATASRVNVHLNISHSYANASVRGVIIAGAGQSIDLHSSIIHDAKASNSLQQHRNVVGDRGEAIFKGRIRIPQRAQLTCSEQHCRSLMMGERPHLVVMPTLEVSADDVECSHGAAVSELDENELFYLAARGIERKESRQLLLRGFVVNILQHAQMDSNELSRVTTKIELMNVNNERSDQQYLSM